MSGQASFSAALLDPDLACPPGLQTWNGSDPARRFAVYRNNVVVSLIDALADSFPVTQELVGEAFFRAMAKSFALANPPRSPVMATYGDGFPDFVAGFPQAAGLPYLGDVARLEWLRIEAYYAADRIPLDPARIGERLADSSALPGLRCALQPSLRLLASPHAVVSLWAAHQGVGDLAEIDPLTSETALVLRVDLDVEVIAIPAAAGHFVAALDAGKRLAEAMAAALAVDAAFDPVLILALLLRKGTLVALQAEGDCHD